jgi:hypothetical protein
MSQTRRLQRAPKHDEPKASKRRNNDKRKERGETIDKPIKGAKQSHVKQASIQRPESNQIYVPIVSYCN